MPKKIQNKVSDVIVLVENMVEVEKTANEAAATDALRESLEAFMDKANTNISKDKLKGFLFEHIEAGKFNVDAARKGIHLKAKVTSLEQGRGTDPVDIEVVNNKGQVSQAIQAKTSKNISHLTKEVQKPKYKDMTKLVPQDQAAQVKDKIRTNENISGEIKHKNMVSSGGTTTDELNKATKDPKGYAIEQESLQIAREAHIMGWEAAKPEVMISSIRNMGFYIQGKIDGKEAAKNVAKDSVKSYAIGMLRSGIRNIGEKTGVKVLSKSNIAATIAAGIIDTGSTIYRYGKGEISAEETVERLGATGFSNLSAIYVGAAAGAIFGIPGALLGSIAGYMLATSVYQSCIAIIKEAQLAEKEAERIENICMEAAKAAMKQREEFKAAIDAYMSDSQEMFDECFQTIDAALDADHPIIAIQALSNFTIRFGKKLQLTDFEDFDEFMIKSDKPLVL